MHISFLLQRNIKVAGHSSASMIQFKLAIKCVNADHALCLHLLVSYHKILVSYHNIVFVKLWELS